MDIAVLGTGPVGRALAARLAELGHQVTLGTRDVGTTLDREDVAEWSEAHPQIRLARFAEAAAPADVVVNASSGTATLDVLAAAGDAALDDKVVMDVANPLDFSAGFPPRFTVVDTDSLAEQVQRAHPTARVVKTLNTMNADVMVHPETVGEGQHTVFVAGDDADAKAVVTALLAQLGHTDVLDLGDLSAARGTEMFVSLWIRVMQALGTATFQVKIVR